MYICPRLFACQPPPGRPAPRVLRQCAQRRAGDDNLDQGKLRGPSRLRAESDSADFGQEPPLSVDGGNPGFVDRRRVSVQWFSGTVLTGLCGAALMGGAVYAALDGETTFGAVPERIEAALRGTLAGISDRLGATARKTDKLPTASEINAARQVIRVSTMARVGDREVVRVRPFIRVASNLSLSASELSANIPPFNPQKLLADASPSGAAAGDAAPEAEPDAEVSFITRDLAALLPKAKIAAILPLEEIVTRVRDVAEWATGSVRSPVNAGLQPGTKLAYAAEGNLDPYVGFEARIVPENITLLPKTANQTTGGNSWNERTVTAKKGESVGAILQRDFGATPEEVKAIAAVLGPRGRDGALKDGQKLRILLAPGEAGQQRLQPIRVILLGDSGIEAVVALSDAGKYVPVDVQHIDNEVAEADEDDDNPNAVRLYQSIYETALRNQVPRPVIDDVIRIYSYDVDFQRRAQPGDSFEVLFAGEDDPGEAKNDVLFTALTVGGETKRYFRYQAPDDNLVDYYDESGKSAKKFLVRKPVTLGMMRSGFGVRRQRKRREGRLGIRLRQVRAAAPRQRLPDRVWSHVRVRPRAAIGGARAPGADHRLCRLDGTVDRRSPPLRDHGERPLRRSDAHQAAARPRAGRPGARRLRARARAARSAAQPRARPHGADRTGGEPLTHRADEARYAACAAASPLNTKPWAPAEITTRSPSLMRPERMNSAKGSCTDFWITRLSGRA